MNRQLRVIPTAVREDIRVRARQTSSDREVGRAIHDALQAAQISWRSVTLDEIKVTLVDAVRARQAASA